MKDIELDRLGNFSGSEKISNTVILIWDIGSYSWSEVKKLKNTASMKSKDSISD